MPDIKTPDGPERNSTEIEPSTWSNPQKMPGDFGYSNQHHRGDAEGWQERLYLRIWDVRSRTIASRKGA